MNIFLLLNLLFQKRAHADGAGDVNTRFVHSDSSSVQPLIFFLQINTPLTVYFLTLFTDNSRISFISPSPVMAGGSMADNMAASNVKIGG